MGMKLIDRKDYLDKIINVIGTPDIKVITNIIFIARLMNMSVRVVWRAPMCIKIGKQNMIILRKFSIR